MRDTGGDLGFLYRPGTRWIRSAEHGWLRGAGGLSSPCPDPRSLPVSSRHWCSGLGGSVGGGWLGVWVSSTSRRGVVMLCWLLQASQLSTWQSQKFCWGCDVVSSPWRTVPASSSKGGVPPVSATTGNSSTSGRGSQPSGTAGLPGEHRVDPLQWFQVHTLSSIYKQEAPMNYLGTRRHRHRRHHGQCRCQYASRPGTGGGWCWWFSVVPYGTPNVHS